MTPSEVLNLRLHNQQIAQTNYSQPKQIVSWMVAMQAQEYAMAKWAIGLRLSGVVDLDIEDAFNQGKILRTHVMRPTWHFVCPEDIRWLLELTANRVNAVNAFMYRKCELDKDIFGICSNLIEKLLEGGRYVTRDEFNKAFEQRGIFSDGVRLSLIMMHAELEGLICSGPRSGNQFTYALLDERVPKTVSINREEALAKLSNSYYASRGPATLHDFVWWSGLTMKDAIEGASLLKSDFVKEKINGKEYIFKVQSSETINGTQTSFLMPDYDEYGISYKDRSALFGDSQNPVSNNSDISYNRMMVVNGRIVGSWKRTIKNKEVIIQTASFGKLDEAGQKAILEASLRYSAFLGKTMSFT